MRVLHRDGALDVRLALSGRQQLCRTMLISKTAEYALRAVVFLADQPDRACPRREISAATNVPLEYLTKILRHLVGRGVLGVQRGAGGGYRLGIAPDRLSVLDVVAAVDPVRRLDKCPLGLAAHADVLCPLHQQLNEAAEQVEQSFRNTVISQLINRSNKRRRSAPCPFPKSLRKRSGRQ